MASVDEIAAWLAAERAPPEVRLRARLLLLDTLGCAISGMRAPEVARLNALLGRLEPGAVAWPGAPGGLSIGSAAYLFALAACFDEACEGSARAHGRPGVATIAAAWALGRASGATLDELVDAVVFGYELAARLGEALRIRPGMHVDATFPSFGAAAAASRLLGAGPAEAAAAIQVAAAQMPVSLYLTAKQGASSRNTYLAHAASLGLQAACAVEAGLQAPREALEEVHRVALGGAGWPGLAAAGEWLLSQGYLKPWAGVRHVHYAAAAAQRLRGELRDPGAIREIRLCIYPEAHTYCGNRAPTTTLQAQFSLSWAVSAMLVTGDLGPEAFGAASLADARIRALEARVTTEPDVAAGQSSVRCATLVVDCGGTRLSAHVDRVAGDPGAPMSVDEVADKFLRFATPSIGSGPAQRIREAILAGDGGTPLGALW